MAGALMCVGILQKEPSDAIANLVVIAGLIGMSVGILGIIAEGSIAAPVQHFAKVAVPDIDGYTHQMQTVDSQTVDFDSDDFEVTVPYTKVQTPNVPDTGTPTGSQSTPGTVTPTGGEDIPTGTQTINGQRQVISTADEPQHQQVQNNSQAQTLPRTGNSEQNGTALAGLGLIGMVGSLFGFKKKRD